MLHPIISLFKAVCSLLENVLGSEGSVETFQVWIYFVGYKFPTRSPFIVNYCANINKEVCGWDRNISNTKYSSC